MSETRLVERSFFKEFGRFGLFFLLFCLVPIGIACSLGDYAFSLEEEFRQRQAMESIEKDLSSVIRRIDPLNFLEDRFARFSRQIFSKPINPARLIKLTDLAAKKWDIPFDAYVFDPSGNLVSPHEMKLRSRNVLQKVWDTLLENPRVGPTPWLRYKKLINNLMGSDFHFPFLRAREGKIMVARARGADGAIYWIRSPGEKNPGKANYAGIILIAWTIPKQSEIMKNVAGRSPYRSMNLAAVKSNGEYHYYWNTLDKNHPPAPPDLFKSIGQRWCYRDQTIWTSVTAGDLSLVAGRRENGLDFSTHRNLLRLFAGLLCLVISGFWYRWLIQGRDLYVSIKVKLILLFLFAIAVPMMATAFLGFRVLRDREKVLIDEKLKEAKDLLTSMDSDFLAEIDRYLTLFRKIRDDPEMMTNPAKVKEKAEKLIADYKLLRLEVRDLEGNVVQTTDVQSAYEGLDHSFESIAKTSIERNIPERWAMSKKNTIEKFDLLTSMIIESPEMGFSYIMDRPDALHPLQFGTNDIFWYWDVYHDKNHPLAFITLAQSIKFACTWFLKTRLKHRFGMYRLFACWHEMGTWYPLGAKIHNQMKDLMDRVRISQQPVITRLFLRGAAYHALGIPGVNIKKHVLIALFREDYITRQIQALRQAIFLGMVLALLVAVITGVALSGTFLTPIEGLSNGLVALSRRRIDFRVPVIDHDELGDLSETFNHMMEDLKEMEMAKIVQESLLPRKVPPIAGYEIEMVNTSASDLGGDYYDILPMKNGNILFVIGDVTGHGASSALLMAMAKAVTFEFSEVGEDILVLMRRLNGIIFHILKKKKLMTLFAAVLNPSSGLLTYSNAGHPFSYVIRASGEKKTLEMIRFPLGRGVRGKAAEFEAAEISIGQGDHLFMYTDGLVESLNRQGEMFGYSRLEKILIGARNLSGKEITRTVLDEFGRHRGVGMELDDDITLGVVKREGAAPEKISEGGAGT